MKAAKAAAAKKKAKKVVVGRSTIVFDVKVWEASQGESLQTYCNFTECHEIKL